MSKIAFILLCHKDPEAIIKHARRLTASGDYMVIHLDANADKGIYSRVTSELKGNENIVFSSKRLKCGWGEWSLVEATLCAVETALEKFPNATHFYMLSGDCMPIKPAEYIHDFLDSNDTDFIEHHDFLDSDWIKTGMKEDRLVYRHFFNERTNKRLFYLSLRFQRWLGLKRKTPQGIRIQIGSQWWCLRRRTVEWIVNFTKERPDVLRFFKTTWIPDETFFQTLVCHHVPNREIQNRTLTFLLFSDYGMPITFYDDHYDMLRSQDFFFARKISPEASDLKRRLSLLYDSKGDEIVVSNEGARLLEYLTGRGRNGFRYTQRFWETQSTLGRNRTLLILVCKKWETAKRLKQSIDEVAKECTIGYVFNDDNEPLPNLGGIESSQKKRSRHRRVFMRMLFDYFETDRILVCIDPSELAILHDFEKDRSHLRILEIGCEYSTDYLIGHAKRVGLASERTSHETLLRTLPTIRNDIQHESDALQDSNFDNFFQFKETDPQIKQARTLADFLGTSAKVAKTILNTRDIFSD